MAVPGQLSLEGQHHPQAAHQNAEPPPTRGLLPLAPGQLQPQGQQQEPGPASFQKLKGGNGQPLIVTFKRLHQSAKPLTPPHHQSRIAPTVEMPTMPCQPRQATQQPPPTQARQGRGRAFHWPCRFHWRRCQECGRQSHHQKRHGRRRLEQQQGATAQAGQADPTAGASVEQQQTPPEQQHGGDQRTVQHQQPSMAGHGQRGHQDQSRGQTLARTGPRSWPPNRSGLKGQFPLDEHHQRNGRGAQQCRDEAQHGFMGTANADGQGNQEVKPWGLVRIGLPPACGQQAVEIRRLGKLQGCAGNAGFVPIP
ncbi:MAG: hypothetical protein F4X84_00990 [Synechococcus sp. SB0662_bin_45]|nr:hypothetical protein [Synechococcus sp. SB0662_bin_45]